MIFVQKINKTLSYYDTYAILYLTMIYFKRKNKKSNPYLNEAKIAERIIIIIIINLYLILNTQKAQSFLPIEIYIEKKLMCM